MGRISEQRIQLRRDSPDVAWGFRLQGGSDANTPLSVQRVFSGSPSDGQLQRGDVVVSVDGRSLRGLSPLDAQDLITGNALVLNLGVERGDGGSNPSYASQGLAQSSYSNQGQDIYSSGGLLPRSQGPSQGSFPAHSPQSSSYQSTWNPSSSTGAAYQPPSQFGSEQDRQQPANYYNPGGGGAPRTNGDHHHGGEQTYKSSATMFGGGHGGDTSYGGSGQHSINGGFYGSDGPSVVSQQRDHENEEDDYERKSVSNIKEMFNKPDETGPRAVGRIKGSRPRAPMYRPNEDTSFTSPQYGPNASAPQKSSLTPSRPGAIQRGTGASSYVPAPVSNPNAGAYAKKLYGYSQDSSPAPSKYVGGFVGVNELTKSVPQPVPVKKPPGQKKKDFDPSQSSVLRVVQADEEERRGGHGGHPGQGGQGGQHGGQGGYMNNEPPRQQQQQPRRGPAQQQRKTGQRWEDDQQHQQRPTVSGKSGGPSLQALLERDQAQNPQEDPANNRIQYQPQPQPSHGEYRRPGTTYKPAEHKVQAANVDDYPIPEHFLSGGRASQPPSGTGFQSNYQQGAGYQTNYQPGEGYQSTGYQPNASFQSSAKFSPGSGGSGGGFSPSGRGSDGYQFGRSADYGRGSGGSGSGFYSSTSYGMDGIPASDF